MSGQLVEQWPLKSLSEVTDFIMGQAPKSDTYTSEENGTPLTLAGDFGELRPSPSKYTTNPLKFGEEGDVFICVVGATSGKVNLGVDASITRSIAALRPKDAINQKFLYYFLQSKYDWINKIAEGSAQPILNRNKLAKIFVPIPSKKEQQRIVSILDETFQNIENSLHGAENNHEFTEDFFQSSLVEMFYDNVDNDSEFEIGEICTLWQGLAINKKTKHLLVNYSSLPLLRIKDLRDGTVEQYVSESGYPPNSAVGLEDVIYTRTGQVGLVFRGRKGILHNNCFKVVPNTDILSREYLFWWLQNPIFKKKIISLSSRAAQPDITHKIFKAQKITVPSLDYQKKAVSDIEERYSESIKIGEIVKNKIHNLHELKLSILQEAFSGTL